MYATVDILADSYDEATILPREAIIDSGRHQIAFVALGDGRFEPRQLQLGSAAQNDSVQVLSGVKPGENVVTSGQFLLDSESRVREAIAKFASGDAAPTSEPAVTSTTKNSNATVASHDQHPAPAAALNVPHADELLDAYLAMSARLGEREPDNASPLDVSKLSDLAQMAATHAGADAKPLVERLSNAVGEMSGKTLEQQRASFIEASNAMIAIARASPPKKTLYRVHCPMAFHSAGADWLQTSEDVANPYYAKEMKACGTVEETIAARK
jgi:hypothetical protein